MAGNFQLHSGQLFLSKALNHGYVGFEEVADRLPNSVYDDTLLGRFDDPTHLIVRAHFRKEKKC